MKYSEKNYPFMTQADKRFCITKIKKINNVLLGAGYIMILVLLVKMSLYFIHTNEMLKLSFVVYYIIEIIAYVFIFFYSANFKVKRICYSALIQIIFLIINMLTNPWNSIFELVYLMILVIRYYYGGIYELLEKDKGFPYFFDWADGGETYYSK